MKIDKERYPHLFTGMYEWPEVMKTRAPGLVLNKLNPIINSAKKDVIYLTNPAYEAIQKSKERLWDLREEIKPACSTLLFSDGKINGALFYAVNVKETEIDIAGMLAGYGFFFFRYPKIRGGNTSVAFDLDLSDKTNKAAFQLIVCFELFRHYAEVETKNLPPKTKLNDGPSCKYDNKSKLPIRIFDSTYFTNLVQSESFAVRGHFRLQACGDGYSKRKLIWIEAFKKQGYTRNATILNKT